MILRNVTLALYRSISYLDFGLSPFTVLFGRNNSGKTNVLEAIYGVMAPKDLYGYVKDYSRPRALRGSDNGLPPFGIVKMELETSLPFDDAVRNLKESQGPADVVGQPLLEGGANLICNDFHSGSKWAFVDTGQYFLQSLTDSVDEAMVAIEWMKNACVEGEPTPQTVFLDWEIDGLDSRVGAMLMDIYERSSKHKETSDFTQALAWMADIPQVPEVLERVNSDEAEPAWRVHREVQSFLSTFSAFATGFLPDFIEGSIQAELQIPTRWSEQPSIRITFRRNDYEPDTDSRVDSISELGRGSARWVAVAIQMALHLLDPSDDASYWLEADDKRFSGHVLFLDEPEAHLHPRAVVSIVRWCHQMVAIGFNVIVASHHDEFLRAAGPDLSLVHVTRDQESGTTSARTLISSATPLLQDLADEVGMHPAVALSLHRAVLFVEGTLDQAVLDEYAGPALESAGVTIIPIHGTKNLQGLIDAELTPRLGIKVAVLTDNTDPKTMGGKSNNKRSGEEVSVTRLVQRFRDRGLVEPKSFGVPEKDLLFALPVEAIRIHYSDRAAEIPDWLDLLEECRAAEGKGKSDSVHWKSYAEANYGVPLTTENGVRSVVQKLDLAGVELPSIRTVVNEIIAWAITN
jgi:energy-coupling factor transporter ATP-binding protein EcfA2